MTIFPQRPRRASSQATEAKARPLNLGESYPTQAVLPSAFRALTESSAGFQPAVSRISNPQALRRAAAFRLEVAATAGTRPVRASSLLPTACRAPPLTVSLAWERSLIELHEKGCALKTEYEKPADPPSKDATMIITITDPLSEPMIHKDFPGGPAELQEYVM
jgi:hypothetical protein